MARCRATRVLVRTLQHGEQPEQARRLVPADISSRTLEWRHWVGGRSARGRSRLMSTIKEEAVGAEVADGDHYLDYVIVEEGDQLRIAGHEARFRLD